MSKKWLLFVYKLLEAWWLMTHAPPKRFLTDAIHFKIKQECIPVGCVPSAAVAAGGCLPRGVSARGVCPVGCVPTGVFAQGGCIPACTMQGVCIPACTGQGCVSQHVLAGRCLLQCMLGYIPLDRILDTRLWKHYLSRTVRNRKTWIRFAKKCWHSIWNTG